MGMGVDGVMSGNKEFMQEMRWEIGTSLEGLVVKVHLLDLLSVPQKASCRWLDPEVPVYMP